MSLPPAHPKIYHITHVKNLPGILKAGVLLADAVMNSRGGPVEAIGMPSIKESRLKQPIGCHPGTMVGDYVPFNFCPRSVMLYVIYMANNTGLVFREGQGQVVHLEADLNTVVQWANANNRLWAYSLGNANARYAEFHSRVAELDRIDWEAIANDNWRDPDVKESKQAEFLVHQSFPWELVTRIGVQTPGVKIAAQKAIYAASHRPSVDLMPDWYY